MRKSFIALLCSVLVPNCLLAEETGELARLFVEATTLREYSRDLHPLIMWDTHQATVATVFEPHHAQRITEDVLPRLQSVRDVIKAETGFTYVFPAKVGADSPANVFLTIGTPQELIGFSEMLETQIGYVGYIDLLRNQQTAGLPVCGLAATWSDSFELKSVAISIDIDADLDKCINETFFQSMGFVNNPKATKKSILGANLGENELTQNDRIMLRALYSGAFEAGDTPSYPDVLKAIEQSKLERE